ILNRVYISYIISVTLPSETLSIEPQTTDDLNTTEPEYDNIFKISPNIDEGQDTEITQTSSFPKILKKMNTSNFKMRSKLPNISPIEKAISKLDSIAKECVVKEDDEFETFGKHVANQLRKIPLERALILQNDIQGLLTRARLHCLSNSQTVSRSSTPSSTLLHSNSTWDYSSDTCSTQQPTIHVNNIGGIQNSCEADILTQAWTTI
ncbi:MADF domain-containing protein, partial [Aphis craccivora]